MDIITGSYFKSCPLCNSDGVDQRVVSLQKDMSEPGYTYNKCSNCCTYYAADATLAKLGDFYSRLPPYQSASSKNEIVNTIVDGLKIDPKSRILDIGCGSGAWAIPFLPYCEKITCVDTDSNAVKLLQDQIPEKYRNNAECIAMDCDEYLDNANSGDFDLVLSMFSFEHQLYPVKFLSQLRKVLAPGGRAIVLVPSGDALQLNLLGNAFYWLQAPWHTFLPTKKGFEIAAVKSGFHGIEVFNPGNDYYSWFWLRGLFDKIGRRDIYNSLRNRKAFVKFDMAIDKLMDRLSFVLKKPSYRFYIIGK